MKEFFSVDVDATNHIITTDGDLVDAPLPWQKQGLHQTASGYGKKLTMREKIHYNGRLYRLYCTIFSNNGTAWFIARGRKITVS
jgi:hypothetical protein